MAITKLLAATAALGLVGGAIMFKSSHDGALPTGNNLQSPPSALPIDGSADAEPTAKESRVAGVIFSELDKANPDLRPKEISISGLEELHEDETIQKIEKNGKPFDLVNFGLLAGFNYLAPLIEEANAGANELPEKYLNQIPAQVTALNESQIAVKGFMIPLEIERGRVKSFVLVRSQLYCCYGQIPDYNEWIHVTMNGNQRIPMLTEIPITVYGDFEVGEAVENGQLMSIYRIRASIVEG